MFPGSDLISYDHLDAAYSLIFCAIGYPYYNPWYNFTRSKISDLREAVFIAKMEIFKQKIIINLFKKIECLVLNSF